MITEVLVSNFYASVSVTLYKDTTRANFSLQEKRPSLISGGQANVLVNFLDVFAILRFPLRSIFFEDLLNYIPCDK